MDWMQLIQNVGFPVAACIALGIFAKWNVESYQKMVSQIMQFMEALIQKEVDDDAKGD